MFAGGGMQVEQEYWSWYSLTKAVHVADTTEGRRGNPFSERSNEENTVQQHLPVPIDLEQGPRE